MRLFFIAGESSGDSRAADVIQHLRRLEPGWGFSGLGGWRMAASGMRLLHDMLDDLDIVGLVDVLIRSPRIFRAYRMVRRELERERPEAVVLVDYPGFNLGLVAPLAHGLGIPVIYYVIPQFWAWHHGRVQKLKKYCDMLIPIFPFEENLLRREGAEAKYLGHPMLDSFAVRQSREAVIGRFGLEPGRAVVGLLPGSREREVRVHLPVMMGAARLLAEEGRPVQFIIVRSPNMEEGFIRSLVPAGAPPAVVLGAGSLTEGWSMYDIRAAMDFSWVKSGTSTLEGALVGSPFVIVYRVNRATAWVGRRVVKVPYFGMPNIVAGAQVVPEFLQEDATPDRLARAAAEYLDDPAKAAAMREALGRVRDAFGPGGSALRVASAIRERVLGYAAR